MENIRRWFENDQVNNGQNYKIYEYEGHLEAGTDTVIFMVVEPHSGTRNRWLLRVTTESAFDRWANSTAVENTICRLRKKLKAESGCGEYIKTVVGLGYKVEIPKG